MVSVVSSESGGVAHHCVKRITDANSTVSHKPVKLHTSIKKWGVEQAVLTSVGGINCLTMSALSIYHQSL